MSNAIIELNNITKKFDGETVLDDITLSVKENEFVTLLGPSGCGKTTTLRIIGGFETPTSGEVYFDGHLMNDVPPFKRQLNTVFQKYALFPHMNVFDNIAFGLRIKKMDEKIISNKVLKMLELFNLKNYGKRRIDQLSGGQQQRIAIARALVNEPKVLLLDEPLGALDLKLRKDMQNELKAMQKKLGITFVYVTHDQEEALTMSDTIVVMNDGIIQQMGTPIDIYNEPENAFVADFIGESNILKGVMHDDYLVEFLGKKFECVDYGFGRGEEIEVVIRPEDLVLTEKSISPLEGIVQSVTFKGVHYEMIVAVSNFEFLVHSTTKAPIGTTVGLSFTPDDIHIMEKGE
ncbi:spermidine/putrescine transport system ATP-binding protein [Sedimentibacter acidaminivorans]|jgi:spermidine/putrescine transport system ATP-binding protein|uniref:Spermidine/putrescine import ATP-binding protein PotA n=1 Tax=Sedimentibacter acidaminivorans TaxID=913099 RepID=A0ABS4GE52_9FIRM|nr:spermidine/putrescine ABC transporter ATP-binding protein [Sedimentibacter acidaminivorans]MBP1925954.1 spermidine/putrescine transport system ATP-binding protein [Sedimentibacter acidaminivorans]